MARCTHYSIQHYVIKFVSDLRHVGVFSPAIAVSSTNKTDCHDIAEILLKVVLNTINQTKPNPVPMFPYAPTIVLLSPRQRSCEGI
jgi:hypothetical protein